MSDPHIRNEEVRGSTPLGSTIPPTSPAPPLRLAILASHFADYSLELALELAKSHAVLLLADTDKLTAECAPERIVQARRALQLHLFRQSSALARATSVASVMTRLSAFSPAALIAHEHGTPPVTLMQRAGARLGRCVLIVHDPAAHAGRDAALAERRSRQIEAQRRGASVLVAHGEACAALLRSTAGSRPLMAIPHGPVLRPVGAPPSPKGSGRLLMCGRMEAYKGLDVLLEACRRLADRGGGPLLHLVGEGPEIERLAGDFSRLPGVRIDRGYASRPALLAALAAADGVVLPYLEATQSGVAAAAFANGRAVLASAVGGLPEVVREGVNGRPVPPDDPAALAEALHRFSREAASLSGAAFATAQGPIAWEHAAAALAEASRADV